MSYRLALRCAYFLGEDGEKRRKIFETLKDAYNIRSKIVHGERVQSKSLSELLMNIEEYLRESIKMFLDCLQSRTHDKIIREIDEKIIAGE